MMMMKNRKIKDALGITEDLLSVIWGFGFLKKKRTDGYLVMSGKKKRTVLVMVVLTPLK